MKANADRRGLEAALLLEAAGLGVVHVDAQGVVTLSQQAAALHGACGDERGATVEGFVACVDEGDGASVRQALGAGGAPVVYRPRGSGRCIELRVSCEGDERWCTLADVSERERLRREAAVDRARMLGVAESLPFALWLRDAQGRVVLQNGASRASWGDITGLRFEDLAVPPQLQELARANFARALSGQVVDEEIGVPVGDHMHTIRIIMAPIREGASVTGVVGVDVDTTTTRELEAALEHAARVEHVGRLVASVAHDFNNLLTAMTACSELLAAGLGDRPEQREIVNLLLDTARRGGALTSKLLTLVRRKVEQPKRTNVVEVAKSMATLIDRLMGDQLSVSIATSEQALYANVDRAQLEQIMINLATNARDATGEHGVLVIGVRRRELRPPVASALTGLAAGPYVEVTVSDSGRGMTQEEQARVLEPFFTTKAPGRGTGLGLSMADVALRQAGGRLWVESERGVGTMVHVLLPEAGAEHAGSGDAGPAPRARDGETVLLVERDRAIRVALTQTLGLHGYRVHEARLAEEALSLVRQTGARVDVLLIDDVTAGGALPVLQQGLRASRPLARVLLMSARQQAPGDDEAPSSDGQCAVIGKPFSGDELARRVRALIDER